MTIKNYTPHVINEVTTKAQFSSDGVARVESKSTHVGEANGMPLYSTTFGEVEGLPPKEPNTLLIVSGMVFDASDRSDLLAPGELVRDDDGKPIGCRGFRTKNQIANEDDILYPLTIVMDRYTGTYSGGKWLAFNLKTEDIPEGISYSDCPCAEFWHNNEIPVGLGLTPEDAIKHLVDQLS